MKKTNPNCVAAWYVSTRGSDANPGTRREPFASLSRAKNAVREARKNGNTSDPGWGERHLAAERCHGIETRSLASDPLFFHPRTGDFRLRPESPAHKLGFVPIPFQRIGRTVCLPDNQEPS